ncbi:MAG TPA: NUDIX domain-containing protein [Chthonomonadaceae bacterium]|nr:NUDIX domain-containing protein [Chthonomonadaceae bacterium]
MERFYYRDPDAPVPNQPLSPGASAVIFDANRRILVLKRARSEYWSLPGGRIDLGESAHDCCIRETFEETGLETRVVRVVSVNTDPSSIVLYPDGNVHRSFFICFEAEVIGGALRASVESEEFRWIACDEIDSIKTIPDSRMNMLDAWSADPAAFIR